MPFFLVYGENWKVFKDGLTSNIKNYSSFSKPYISSFCLIVLFELFIYTPPLLSAIFKKRSFNDEKATSIRWSEEGLQKWQDVVMSKGKVEVEVAGAGTGSYRAVRADKKTLPYGTYFIRVSGRAGRLGVANL